MTICLAGSVFCATSLRTTASLTPRRCLPAGDGPWHELEPRTARSVVLKLKTSEFKILTRSHTPAFPPSSCEELTDIALKLRERVDLGPQQRYRLVGVGLSNFRDREDDAAQADLFQLQR